MRSRCVVLLPALRGRRGAGSRSRDGGPTLWLSGVCWAVMFTAFMVALTMTTRRQRARDDGARAAADGAARALRARPPAAGAHLGGGRSSPAPASPGCTRNEVGRGRRAPPRRQRGRARRAARRRDQLDRDPAQPAAAAADLLPAVLIGAAAVGAADLAAGAAVQRLARTTSAARAARRRPARDPVPDVGRRGARR